MVAELMLALVCGTGAEAPKGYVPPLLSNGELSMNVDWTCGMRAGAYAGIKPGVWWEGRRFGSSGFGLMPFGTFKWEVSVGGSTQAWPDKWEQRLDAAAGTVETRGIYTNGVSIESAAFVPFGTRVIAVRHTVTCTAVEQRTVALSLVYAAPGDERMPGAWSWDAASGRAVYSGKAFGEKVNPFTIAVFSTDTECQHGFRNGREAVLLNTLTLKPGESRRLDYFMRYSDAKEQNPPEQEAFDALQARHVAAWAAYYAESSIRVPDPAIQRMAEIQQYHLRCNATKWSFPVGILPSHWQGRYFGWDEMFCHQGLIAAGHVEIARRCPEFRKAVLPKALQRVRHYNTPGKFGARFVWETCEDGVSEGSPQGFWLDHIFHISNIAREAWVQYLYSDDLDYLKSTGYPLILECARYFRNNWVYTDSNGEMYIGKCTDLERLGPSRDRPFMTTCGAVYAFRAAADAAGIVGADDGEAADFRKVADRLVESLPQKNGAYVAYKDCTAPSVATLGGLFPYPIFGKENALQKEAAYRFVRNGRAAGNMYPTGKGVCPWYAGWMAEAMTLLEDDAEPARMLSEAAAVTGLFGETFEINEPDVVMHPWFATASGNCLYALCQMLLCDAEGETRVAFGVPKEWRDYSFRLPAYQGVLVDAEVKGGKLVRLRLVPRHAERKHVVRLVLRASLADMTSWSKNVPTREKRDGKIYITVPVSGETDLVTE